MAAGGRFTFSDMQNPLFLHPSDGPTSVTVSKLQCASDFRSWKRSIEIQLAAKRKLGFVDGSVLKSTTDPVDAAQWDTCNNLVISWLHNNVLESIRHSILYMTSAVEIWNVLEKRFLLTNGSRKYKLNKDLFELKQSQLTIAEYYTKLTCIWEEIDCLNVLPAVSVVTPEVLALLNKINVLRDESKLFQFLNGLNEVYAPQRSQLLMMMPLPTVEVACAALQQEESQHEVLHSVQPSSDFDSVAMFSQGSSGTGTVFECSVCHKKGHTSDRCWMKIGYPKWHDKHKLKAGGKASHSKWSGNNSTNSGNKRMSNNAKIGSTDTLENVSLTSQQLQQLLKLIPHTDTDDELDDSFSGMVTCCLTSAATNNQTWIVDTGATDYMTAFLDRLVDVKKAPPNSVINLPNSGIAKITHIGNLTLQNGLFLKVVLYVPTFNHNLLSIRELAQDNDCHATFTPNECIILSNSVNSVLATGVIDNGLYCFVESSQKLSNVAVFKDSALWHKRFGHVSKSTMNHMPQFKHLTADSNAETCLTCPLAKFAKIPYQRSTSHAAEPFDLVHLDTWGPYKVSTRGHFRYFLTLVDDHTHMTWVYLLRHKSDFLERFTVFQQYVKNHFKSSVKTLRSDNAPESSDAHASAYYKKHGIVHQTSCPYRPQQNSRVERKHRHILELSRALRFQSGLPLMYWGDCVMSAVYIMNRLPTAALNHKVPYELLFKEAVDYTEFRVFGCLAMVANPEPTSDKFAPKAIPCVFYIAVEKGHADTAKMLCTTCTTQHFLVGPAGNLTALHAVVKKLDEDVKDVIEMIIDQIKKHNTNVLHDEIFYETDEDGYTVLEVAVEQNQMEVVNLILDLQHPAASKRNDGAFISLMPVIYKADGKRYTKIVDLLTQRYDEGSKLSKDFKDQVRLISAIKSGDKDTVVSLLDAGRGGQRLVTFVDKQRLVTFVDKLGWTALHHAVYHESIPIIKHIAEAQKGIKPKSGYKDKVPTPFHVAVQKGRTSIVTLLMQLWPTSSSTYTAVDKKGQNILHLAALQSKKDMIEGILKNCPAEHKKEFVNKQNNNGYTTLHVLIQRGCFVPELLKYEGLDTSVKNNKDWTPLDMLYVEDEIRMDQAKIKVALDHFQINGKKDIFSSSVFTTSERERKDVEFRKAAQKMIDGMLALMRENSGVVAKCYADAIGGDPISRAALEIEADTPNKEGETILHVESKNGAIENVRFILSAFAKKNLLVRLDNRKQSALHLAARHGHAKVVEALLSAVKRNLPPSSALHADFKPLLERSDESRRTPLELAMFHNHVNAVELILLEDPAYQDGRGSRNQGLLHLISQARENKYNEKIVQLLCATFETGIDPNLKGVVDLIMAIQRHDADPISKLLEGDQDNKHFLNFVDSEGWTLLHHAAYHQFDSILSVMIEAQEKVGYQFVCKEGVATPFHVAARCGHTSTVIRLLRLWQTLSRYTTVDENGQNIMQAAPSPYTAVDENGQNILHLAALKNKKEMVNGILKCCPPKQKDQLLFKKDGEGNTPLHSLVSEGCFIQDLIKYIAGDTTNNDGWTPRDMLYIQHDIVGDQVQIKMALHDHMINTDKSRKLWSGSRRKSTSSSLAVLPHSRREKKDVLFNEGQNELTKKKNKKMQEDLQRYREGTNSQIVVSALITTITFTVGFTIPGGLHQSGESNQGLAVLSKKAAFKIFMIADAFALLLSICSLFIYFLENMSEDLEHVTRLHAMAVGLNIASVMLTMFVFMTGTYVVLSESLSLSITICVIGSLFFIFVIFQLLKIAYERVRKNDDYKKEA
ncbi:uncharacterized protein LOC135149402 [Daucus carota subsp. sativus]|uniref:uncharacterized protein LOC135149402 n=1 Tax=Daucus carota subsp. sativus TaxID=79200 RepID=UPI003083245B